MDFSYEVVRLWEQPVRRFLEGGLGTLPLASLCRLAGPQSLEEALAPVLRRVVSRLEVEATPEERARLLAATYVLAGLRVTPPPVERLFQGVQSMKESSTYQAILAEGRIEGRLETLRNMLLRQGRQRFNRAPSASVQARIQAITDAERLERMADRILNVTTWQELLQTP
jgi:predicted transposase YdaD